MLKTEVIQIRKSTPAQFPQFVSNVIVLNDDGEFLYRIPGKVVSLKRKDAEVLARVMLRDIELENKSLYYKP